MKSDRFIVIFYLLYFGLLFTILFLSPDQQAVDFYTIIIAIIYFIIFRERFDTFFFAGFSMIPLIMNSEAVQYTPLWMPIAWGITAVTLRKFVLTMTRLS